ncbi:uncharacterized protein LOC133737733 [Rosa rugosa]|uniref:uncharacterized protein LOC133737733 n=1 Tax=Rosa rugosa TaxID=74645 RepID=UPI002B40F16F|nr:uncharacterized protein LOC133737733 [Rosa rugosa]
MSSDHCPLLFENDPPMSRGGNWRRKRRFLFEDMWLTHEGCRGVVERQWLFGVNSVVGKLEQVAGGLKRWNQETFGSVKKKVASLREELDVLQRQPPTSNIICKRNEVECLLDGVLEREELLWKQRARVSWFKCGDRNTQFFHQTAKQRGRSNRICGILGEDNRWRSDVTDIGCVFVSYFRNLFTAGGGSMDETIFEAVTSRVDATSKKSLDQVYRREEIELALKDMNPSKSPGSDGMPARFFQKFWNIIGNDVVDVCLRFLNGDGSIAEFNHSLIALIPKVQNPKKVTEYRPISLCNVVYKLVSKVLANRLKSVLPEVIAENQSAFMSQRLIHDNIIAAFEIIHCLKRRGKDSRQKIALKLDMTKAYDRVEWGFLQRMMEVMGFPDRFVFLIMDCVKSVTYSVLLQGAPFGKIKPSRGLRQGDPISPYLFLIVAEGLSALIRKAEREQQIHGVAIARGAPSVSHLFYADDSLLFCDATVTDCMALKNIFSTYEAASGQKINKDKSAICFSPKSPAAIKEACSAILDMQVVPCHERYLGLPTVTGKDKKKLFQSLPDRVWNRVHGWEGKLLSKAGKEVLIKIVAQAIPNYTMSVFQLPAGTSDAINKCVARFWWGKEGGKGIHWRRWSDLCFSKKDGGLGFRDLSLFNQALLGKQGWRLMMYPDSLVARMLKAKYFPWDDFMEAELGSSPSYLWRSFLWGRELLRKGVRWRIGDGKEVRVFIDPWVPGLPSFRPILRQGAPLFLRVSDLLHNNGGWNMEALNYWFTDDECEAISSITVGATRRPDVYMWNYCKNGRYTVKSGYWLACEENREEAANIVLAPRNFWKHLWKLKLPPKINHFLWRCSMGFIPCMEVLLWKQIAHSASCLRFQQGRESPVHATWGCSCCVAVFERAGFYSKLSSGQFPSFIHLLHHAFSTLDEEELQFFAVLLWLNWHERNNFYHERNNFYHKGAVVPSDIIYENGVKFLKCFKEALGCRAGVEFNAVEEVVPGSLRRWQAPRSGQLKVNCDGAANFKDRCFGGGTIIRDEFGSLIVAGGKNFQHPVSSLVAELLAIKVGLDLVVERRLRNVMVESDCLEAIHLLNSKERCLAPEGGLVEDIQNTMALVNISSIYHVRREGNTAAHAIAKFVARNNGRYVWLEDGPDWLMSLIYHDKTLAGFSVRELSTVSLSDSREFGESYLCHFHDCNVSV